MTKILSTFLSGVATTPSCLSCSVTFSPPTRSLMSALRQSPRPSTPTSLSSPPVAPTSAVCSSQVRPPTRLSFARWHFQELTHSSLCQTGSAYTIFLLLLRGYRQGKRQNPLYSCPFLLKGYNFFLALFYSKGIISFFFQGCKHKMFKFLVDCKVTWSPWMTTWPGISFSFNLTFNPHQN